MNQSQQSFSDWPDFLLQEMADSWLFASTTIQCSYPLILASGPILYQFKKTSQHAKWLEGTYDNNPLHFLRIGAGTCELEPALYLLKQKNAKGILFLSICGALDPQLEIGQIVQITQAEIGEGMSLYYQKTFGEISSPFQTWKTPFPRLSAFTTQSLLKETQENLTSWSKKHQVIECEFSALFTLSQWLKIPVLALSVVSDIPLKQATGIKTKIFRKRCQEALKYLQQIQLNEQPPQ